MAAFGDSFVHGDESPFEDTWGQQLEAIEPRIEVMNFGVGSYGLDQAWLRYQAMGRRYRPRVVVIGFMTDDLGRAVNRFRPFHTPRSLVVMTKPRFVLDGGALRLVPNPLPTRADYAPFLQDETATLRRIGADDFERQLRFEPVFFDFLRSVRIVRLAWHGFETRSGRALFLDGSGFYDVRAEAFAVNRALLEAFAAEVRRDGSEPLVVFFPGQQDFDAAGLQRRNGRPIYEPLRVAVEALGIPVLDCFPALREAVQEQSPDKLFRVSHYSAMGHCNVARALETRLFSWLADVARGAQGDPVDQARGQKPHEASQAPP